MVGLPGRNRRELALVSVSVLLEDYDITKGELWPAVVVGELFGPAAIRSVRRDH
jgi:hypothetical protein